tara:strand:+ start:446 stop:1282 length:837 start_codon:yes stop_codon:yes gene_type:complete
MSKITVTTIAGQTSGADANTVKIESGDDFAVDTNVLKVDASNNRVGINTTSPSNDLHISSTNPVIRLQDTSTNAYAQIFTNDAGSMRLRADAGNSQSNSNFILEIDGTTQLSVDSSGRVVKPNQPSFQARSNLSNQNLSTAAGTTIALTGYFTAEYFDIGGHYNATNSTFTAPVAGRYYFYTQLQLNSNPSTSDHSWGINLHFQVNGAGNHANGYNSLSTSATTLFGTYGLVQKENILNLAANDTVRVALSGNANINAGTIETSTNDGRCRFGGHFLG